jgi:hypothetical protein
VVKKWTRRVGHGGRLRRVMEKSRMVNGGLVVVEHSLNLGGSCCTEGVDKGLHAFGLGDEFGILPLQSGEASLSRVYSVLADAVASFDTAAA